MYVLKQVPIAWNKKIGGFLKEARFTNCAFIQGMYFRRSRNNEMIIICLYVDNMLITGNCEKEN